MCQKLTHYGITFANENTKEGLAQVIIVCAVLRLRLKVDSCIYSLHYFFARIALSFSCIMRTNRIMLNFLTPTLLIYRTPLLFLKNSLHIYLIIPAHKPLFFFSNLSNLR